MRGVLAVLVVIALAASARADDRENREIARREFAAGQAADRQRDWQGAIEHYLRANDLVEHPFTIFNIGTDYQRLGKLREAATWFERYVAATADASDRERVNRLIAELHDRPASLRVTSSPSGARVAVDGRPVGTTPYVGTLPVGKHAIAVEQGGMREAQDVDVAFAEPVEVDLALRAQTGTVRLVGEPIGATVTIDGVAAGQLPARLALPPGEHRVVVTSAGYAPFETTVTVVAGRDTEVQPRLERGTGSVLGTPPSNVLKVGYLFGGVAGADARGSGAMYQVEFGVRALQYDAGARIGKQADLLAVDLFFRWALTPGRIAPYITAAYSFIQSGGGYALGGGLRMDLIRSDRAIVSLMAESGVRYFAGSTSDTDEPSKSTSGVIVPVLASLLVTYK